MSTKKLTDSKYMLFLLFLSWLVYFVGYLARLDYGAVMPEIIRMEGISKASAGLVSTGASVSYAIGQIVSGILGDRFSPRLVMFSGIFGTAFCNLLMPLVPSVEVRLTIWCLNGFAQAMLWPPMLRIFTESYRKKDLAKMYVRVSTSNTVGTILVYLLASLCIAVANWKYVFYISSLLGFIVSFLWLWGMRRIEIHKETHGIIEESESSSSVTEKPHLSFKILAGAGIFFMAGAILLHGALKDSVTTWMPNLIMDAYNLESAVAILATVVMPIFSMLCLYVASFLNNRIFKNEAVTSTVLFAVGFIGSIGIRFCAGISPALSLLFGTMITSAMYGANLMLITEIPGCFSKFGKASTLTGTLNACAYAGSAISTYGIGALSDRFGWNAALNTWVIAAGVGTLLCIFSIRCWTRFKQKIGATE